jgi:hypothetical protein
MGGWHRAARTVASAQGQGCVVRGAGLATGARERSSSSREGWVNVCAYGVRCVLVDTHHTHVYSTSVITVRARSSVSGRISILNYCVLHCNSYRYSYTLDAARGVLYINDNEYVQSTEHRAAAGGGVRFRWAVACPRSPVRVPCVPFALFRSPRTHRSLVQLTWIRLCILHCDCHTSHASRTHESRPTMVTT